MADEIKDQLDELALNVKSFKETSEKVVTVEGEIKAAKEEAGLVKEDLRETKDQVKVIKDAQDKIIEAQDKMIAENKATLVTQNTDQSLEGLLKKALDEHTDDIGKLISKDNSRKDFAFTLKAVGDMSVANVTGSVWAQVQRPGIITPPARKVHIRDIVPMGTIGRGTEYVFMSENGDGEGAIAPVAEGAMKPQIDLDLIESSVKIETIAGWLRPTRKAMNNIQGFTSWVQTRIIEKLLRVEDNQLLNGNGVSPNIKGIQVAGNFTAASGSATIDLEQLIDAVGQLEELEREATAIVVRPADYYRMLEYKASTSGIYTHAPVITIGTDGALRVLGLPVIRTTAQTVDKFLVGDFNMGCQLLIQEGIRVEFFEQDGTNVRENKVTIRIEETVAFPVYGSTFFIYGDFGNAS